MKKKHNGRFRRGADPRRHKLTRRDCSKGGKRTWKKMQSFQPPFDRPEVYAYVYRQIRSHYRKGGGDELD